MKALFIFHNSNEVKVTCFYRKTRDIMILRCYTIFKKNM